MLPTYITVLITLCFATSTIFTILSFKKTLLNMYLKTFSSMLFTILGLFSLFALLKKTHFEIANNTLIGGFLLLLGLILCLIGDIILGMPRISELKRDYIPVVMGGAAWFALGHITYGIALCLLFGVTPWVICFIIPMAIFFTFANLKIGKLDYHKLTVGVFAYGVIESFSFAVCACALIFNYSTLSLILTIGFFLFFFSDNILMHNYFGEKKRINSILCHSTYFPAQILIAISIFFLV